MASTSSAFAAALAATPRSKKGGECSVCKLLRTLPPKESADLAAALADVDNIQGSQIGRALRGLGHSVRDDGVTYHRREQHVR